MKRAITAWLLLGLSASAPCAARAGVALDTTAHPSGAGNLTASAAGGSAWQTLTPSAFSTGTGPVVIRAYVYADGSSAPWGGSAGVAWVGGTPSGWSAFTKWVDETDSAHEFGWQIWTAFSASTAATTQQVRFTANTSSVNQAGWIGLLVENGCASTEAAARGATAGYIDQVGSNTLLAQAITPTSTGSSLAGGFGNANSKTALTANSSTSTFDAHFEAAASDAIGFGRYKVSGTYTTSTAGTAKTLGTTNTDQFTSAAVTEIQPPSAGGAVLAGTSSGAATTTGALSTSIKLAGSTVGVASTAGALTTQIKLAGSSSGIATTSAWLKQYPLSVSSNGHYFVDALGHPFRVQGDAGWDALYLLPITDQATGSDLGTYLANRAAKGFNTIIMEITRREWAAASLAPADKEGNLPFTKATDGSNYTVNTQLADLSTANSSFFADLDGALNMAAKYGMLVALTPAYSGFGNPTTQSSSNEGWSADLNANSSTQCHSYGLFLGGRYASFPNILWVAGGDQIPTHPSNIETCEFQIMKGVRDAGDTHPWTAHWNRTHNSIDNLTASSTGAWDVDAVYVLPMQGSGTPNAQGHTAYSNSPAAPAFVIENWYEGEHSTTAALLRAEAYGSVLSTGAGYIFGNNPVWLFDTGWQTAMDATGSQDMSRMSAFWNGLAWQKLAPSTTAITSGGGTEAGGDYVAAAADPAGSLLVAFVPDTHTGTVTVDMTKMGATTRSRWFDPTNGTFAADATGLAPTGTHVFTLPGTNSAGANDLVLVLDSISLAGSIAGAASTSGALTTGIPLAGSSSGVATDSGALTTAIQLAASSQGAATTAGALTTQIQLAGSTAGAAATSGALTTGIPLAGSSAGAATTTSALTTAIQLACSSQGIASASASLTTQIQLAGSTAGMATASATFVGTSPPLAGTSAGSAATSASLTTSIQLLGSTAGVGATSGSLTTSIVLAGSAAGAASTSAGLSTAIVLGGSSPGTAAVTGALSTAILLAGGSQGFATTTGTLTTNAFGISGTSSGVATVTGSLSTAIYLAGITSGSSTTFASLAGQPPLVALSVVLPVDPFILEVPADEPRVRPFTWTYPMGDAPSARVTLTAADVAQNLTGYTAEIKAQVNGTLVTEPGELEAGSSSTLVTMLPDLSAVGTWKAAAILTSPTGTVTTRTGTLEVRDHGQYWNWTVAAGATPTVSVTVTLSGKVQSLAGGSCELVGTHGAASFTRGGTLAAGGAACLVTLRASDTASAGSWDAALVVTQPSWPGPRSSFGRLVIRDHP